MFSFCNDKPIGSVSIWSQYPFASREFRKIAALPREKTARLASRPTQLVKARVHNTRTHTRTQPSRNKVTFPLPDITYSGIKAGHEAVLVRTTRMDERTKSERVNEKNRAKGRGKLAGRPEKRCRETVEKRGIYVTISVNARDVLQGTERCTHVTFASNKFEIVTMRERERERANLRAIGSFESTGYRGC